MSLAATTTTTLTVIDSLKPISTVPLVAPPKAHVWSSDNTTLYILSSNAIHAFSSAKLTKIYHSPLPLQPLLLAKDNSTLIFAQGSTVHLLALAPAKIAASLTGHTAPVISLSLSTDATLLASASASGTLHLHNLTHNSHTVLRPPSTKNTVCAFHPHARTRLLVGSGRALLIYDTSRPAAPLKSVPIVEHNEGPVGPVVAVASSPFSKSLLAVACSSGYVALVDLDKDKPFFKRIHVNVPVSSMVFTADGKAIALGTEHGKVVLQDLQRADAPPRTLSVGPEDNPESVIALSIQRRIKGSRITTSHSAPLAQRDLNHRVTPGNAPVTPRARVFSPPKAAPVRGDDDADISVQLDTLMTGGLKPAASLARTRASSSAESGAMVRTTSRPALLSVADRDRRASGASSTGSTRKSGASSATAGTSTRTSTNTNTRTPTPELPCIDDESPVAVLTTPEMERWIEAGKGTAGGERRVGWADEDGGASAPVDNAPGPAFELSPVRRAMHVSPGKGGAQELLRAVVKDIMHEYRQETREDIKGLHLDLLRVGWTWKSELRTMMDEYVGDLRDLREENVRLRKENERLRRGF